MTNDTPTASRKAATRERSGRPSGRTDAADPISRRQRMADAVIRLMGEHGAREVTHRKVDKFLGLPEGSTSSYFRRLSDLFRAGIARLSEYDLEALAEVRNAIHTRSSSGEPLGSAEFSELLFAIWKAATEPDKRYLLAARFEYFLLADRDDDIRSQVSVYLGLLSDVDRLIFEKMGAADPDRSAEEYGIFRRGLYFSLLIHPPDFREPVSAAYFQENLDRFATTPGTAKP